MHEAVKKENDRTNALIEGLKADMSKERSREDHDRLVGIMTDHIQKGHRLRMAPAPNSRIVPGSIYW